MLEKLGYIRIYKLPFLKPFWNGEELGAILDCLFKNNIVDGPDIARFEKNIEKK